MPAPEDQVFTYNELRICMVAFALWLKSHPNEKGDAVALLDKFLADSL